MVERIIVGPLHTNTYIVSTGKKECILVDPGADGDHIFERLEALNMKPVAIVFTHGHLDHTAAAERIRMVHEGIPIAIHEADAALLHGSSREHHLETLRLLTPEADLVLDQLFTELPVPDLFLSDGDTVMDSDLAVVHTPGHTPGSVCFYSEERKALFSGDTLLFAGVGNTDQAGGDAAGLLASIKEKIFQLPEDTRLFPGHGPLSSIEREIQSVLSRRP